MATYWHIIIFSLLGGVASLIGGVILLSRERIAQKLAQYATPFAAGALLAAVFLDLLKDGFAHSDAQTVLNAALAGILLFFLAERFLRWFHHHHQREDKDPAVPLIVAGDTVHNLLDGVAIAAAFLVSIPTGIVTTAAVAAHEIPQEIGDFGLLLRKGVRRRNVLLVNVLSALATVLAAVITFAVGSQEALPVGFLLGISAGFLLYIALSDIIPTLHAHANAKRLFDWQPLLLLAGVVIVAVAVQLAHGYIDAGHDHATEDANGHQSIESAPDHDHAHEGDHGHETSESEHHHE